MEQARLLIAIVLSAVVFLVWQFFFVDRDAVQKTAKKTEQPPANTEQVQPAKPYAAEQEDAVTKTTGVTETAVAKPAETSQAHYRGYPALQGQDLGEGRRVHQFYFEKLQRNGCQGFSLKRNHSPGKRI